MGSVKQWIVLTPDARGSEFGKRVKWPMRWFWQVLWLAQRCWLSGRWNVNRLWNFKVIIYMGNIRLRTVRIVLCTRIFFFASSSQICIGLILFRVFLFIFYYLFFNKSFFWFFLECFILSLFIPTLTVLAPWHYYH